jgi:hypothetical protein
VTSTKMRGNKKTVFGFCNLTRVAWIWLRDVGLWKKKVRNQLREKKLGTIKKSNERCHCVCGRSRSGRFHKAIPTLKSRWATHTWLLLLLVDWFLHNTVWIAICSLTYVHTYLHRGSEHWSTHLSVYIEDRWFESGKADGV